MKKKKWIRFNVTHPELKEGEQFLWNISNTAPLTNTEGRMRLIPAIDEAHDRHLLQQFAGIQYATKRLGETAYDDFGNIIPDSKPVFVSKTEFAGFLHAQPSRDYYCDKV